MRSSVDLPQPDGPTRTRNSPLSILERDVVDGRHAAGEDLADVVEVDLGHSSDRGVYTASAIGKQWH